MNPTQTTDTRKANGKSAATEGKSAAVEVLNGGTQGKFVLFSIPASERKEEGPVMRGFVEIEDERKDAEPVKVQVAGWTKIARDSGNQYLSLKVANSDEEDREDYTVGPYYGRLFKEATKRKTGEKVRYYGFIEDAEKVGEDEDGKGVYERHWQLAVRATRAVSRDGKTVYISGTVGLAHETDVEAGDIAF